MIIMHNSLEYMTKQLGKEANKLSYFLYISILIQNTRFTISGVISHQLNSIQFNSFLNVYKLHIYIYEKTLDMLSRGLPKAYVEES